MVLLISSDDSAIDWAEYSREDRVRESARERDREYGWLVGVSKTPLSFPFWLLLEQPSKQTCLCACLDACSCAWLSWAIVTLRSRVISPIVPFVIRCPVQAAFDKSFPKDFQLLGPEVREIKGCQWFPRLCQEVTTKVFHVRVCVCAHACMLKVFQCYGLNYQMDEAMK